MRNIMQALGKKENVKRCEKDDCKNEIDWEEIKKDRECKKV
jgi:hypothetical protein